MLFPLEFCAFQFSCTWCPHILQVSPDIEPSHMYTIILLIGTHLIASGHFLTLLISCLAAYHISPLFILFLSVFLIMLWTSRWQKFVWFLFFTTADQDDNTLNISGREGRRDRWREEGKKCAREGGREGEMGVKGRNEGRKRGREEGRERWGWKEERNEGKEGGRKEGT